MIVAAGSTDVTTYFVLRLAANGTELTGATITDMDLQYVRSGAAPAAKVDATALAATDSAHADNKAIEVDGTDAPGLYRVDWPDAAFAAGAREVILSVKYATAFTEHLRVELSPAVDAVAISGDTAAADNAESFFDGTGYAGTNNTIPTVTNVTNAVNAAVTSIGNNVITSAAINDGAITNAKVADDVDVNVKTITAGAIVAASFASGALDAVWSTAARTLTSYGSLVSDIATAVWGAGTRTLTSFGTLAADAATAVWAAGTRTLSSYGSLVADVATAVWGAVTRTLTATSAPSDMAKESTLTAIKGAGWSASTDTLEAIRDAIPSAAPTVSDIRTELEGVGTHLTLVKAKTDNLPADPAGVSDLPGEPPTAGDIATAVWGAGTRTLTSFGSLAADVATAVWAAGTRTLTGFGSLVADVATAVWTAVARTLTATSAPDDMAKESTLEAIKGVGWSDETLVAIQAAIPAAAPTVEEIRTELEGVGTHLTLIKTATDLLPADPAGVGDLPSEPPSATDIRTELEAEGTTLYAVAAAADALLVRTPNATAGEPTGLPVLNAEGDLAVTISEEQAEALALAIAETIEVPPADVDEAAIAAAILDAVLTAHVTPDSLAVVVKAINATLGGVFGTGTLLKTFTSKDNATGLALPGVLVTCWRDATLITQNGGTQVSDAAGETKWLCVEGETYYFVQQLSGYTFEVEEEVA